jgi:hypothetical protein
VSLKLIEKLQSGEYMLTAGGKEFANNLSKYAPRVQKQPKLSITIIASKMTKDGKVFLFQKRRRSPHYGFWGCITGPVRWGESFENAAKREFEKQTGLKATYKVSSFHRKTDYEPNSEELLEDKLFAIIEASHISGEITNSWAGGFNVWMSLVELESKEKYFGSTREILGLAESEINYSSEEAFYTNSEY